MNQEIGIENVVWPTFHGNVLITSAQELAPRAAVNQGETEQRFLPNQRYFE
jgi:hypothetical protein